jgi:hypothetical protein
MAEFRAYRSDCERMLHLLARTFAPLTTGSCWMRPSLPLGGPSIRARRMVIRSPPGWRPPGWAGI